MRQYPEDCVKVLQHGLRDMTPLFGNNTVPKEHRQVGPPALQRGADFLTSFCRPVT